MIWLEWDDNRLLALCLWREARGEGEAGMRAVCHVIRNRMKAWHQTLRQVVLGKNQFTSMSVSTDPIYRQLPDDNGAVWKLAIKIAEESGGLDPTNGALYYFNPKTANSGWFQNNIVGKPQEHPQVAVIGHHVFFK